MYAHIIHRQTFKYAKLLFLNATPTDKETTRTLSAFLKHNYMAKTKVNFVIREMSNNTKTYPDAISCQFGFVQTPASGYPDDEGLPNGGVAVLR
jgi:hypothetical protein